jgi:hypothetical protein
VGNLPEEEGPEDAMWTACSAWANFEPVPGKPKVHSEILYFPEASTYFFEGDEDTLFDLSGTSLYQDASPYRKQLIEDLCLGFRKFEAPPVLNPFGKGLLRGFKGAWSMRYSPGK